MPQPSLLLPPSERVRAVEQPASLLQKAIRRSSALCSPLPLLEACRALMDLTDADAYPAATTNGAAAHAAAHAAAVDAATAGATYAATSAAANAAAANPAAANAAACTNDGEKKPPRGGPFKLFWTIATCAFNDAAPCAPSSDGRALGCAELIALALAARVEPSWVPPEALVKQAVCTALRLQASARAEQVQGHITKVDTLKDGALQRLEGSSADQQRVADDELPTERRGAAIRDAVRCALAVLGVKQHDKVSWRSQQQRGLYDVLSCYLVDKFAWAGRMESLAAPSESAVLTSWPALPTLAELVQQPHASAPAPTLPFPGATGATALVALSPAAGTLPSEIERLRRLDDECRLAAHDQSVCKELLLLLQASLAAPPRDERKHSLLCLSRHVAK